eukprot:280903-Chlamydomonas_euryale.AAC.1
MADERGSSKGRGHGATNRSMALSSVRHAVAAFLRLLRGRAPDAAALWPRSSPLQLSLQTSDERKGLGQPLPPVVVQQPTQRQPAGRNLHTKNKERRDINQTILSRCRQCRDRAWACSGARRSAENASKASTGKQATGFHTRGNPHLSLFPVPLRIAGDEKRAAPHRDRLPLGSSTPPIPRCCPRGAFPGTLSHRNACLRASPAAAPLATPPRPPPRSGPLGSCYLLASWLACVR